MDLKVETIDPCKKRMKITIPSERVDREIQQAFQRLANSAKVRGFRQGKVPRNILELHYRDDVIKMVRERLIEESASTALKEKGIRPAIAPLINTVNQTPAAGAPFHYEFDVETWPEFNVSGYTGVKVLRKKAEVKDEDVETYIKTLQEQQAEFVPVENRPLAMGDIALLDFKATVDGAVFDDKKGVWIEIGPTSYIPGFCEKLVGINCSETRSFTLALPNDIDKEDLRGREANFTITLREIKLKKIPELNDDFCKEVGSYANLEELRAAVRKELVAYAKKREEEGIIQQINDYLLKHNKIPLPASRVDLEARELAEKAAGRLLAQGVAEGEILKKKDELITACRKEAEKNLALSFIYSEIAKREKIAVTPEEMQKRLEMIAARLKKSQEQIRVLMEKEGRLDALEDQIRREKTEAFLTEKARIKEAS